VALVAANVYKGLRCYDFYKTVVASRGRLSYAVLCSIAPLFFVQTSVNVREIVSLTAHYYRENY